jgi:tripartite-type tricarboxylate transporter receptor subunit TctC
LPKAVFEPGNLAFGSPGHGTINQLAVEWLALEAGIKLLHVPYRGGAAPVNGLAAGDTALGVTTLTSVKASLTGKIKVVVQLNRERPTFLQQWPTMTDAGLNVDAGLTLGLYAPANTPAAIVSRLDSEMLRIRSMRRCASVSMSLAWRPPRSARTSWPSASAAKPRGSSRSSSSPA